jgi:pimeloyl-ACP methyl ester carboxylesterase
LVVSCGRRRINNLEQVPAQLFSKSIVVPAEITLKFIAQRLSAAIVVLAAITLTVAVTIVPQVLHAKESSASKPTVVLVHGAFAGSSSWNAVIAKLLAKGYPVVAVAVPLRGVKSDGIYVASLLDSIKGPVILVGHSYGGNVISVAAKGKSNVKALVYVSRVAPDIGESASSLSAKFPGSTLGLTLAPPVLLADGSKDLYIQQDKFHAQFAADVPASEAK